MIFLQAKQERNKYFFKKLWLLYILASFSFPSHSSLPDNIKKSVWKIQSDSGHYGTAFFISPNHFVTSFSVLRLMLNSEDSLKSVVLQQEGASFDLTASQIVMASTLYDLALVETKESVSSYLTIKKESLNPNGKMFVLGYPQGQFKKLNKTGRLFEEVSSYTFSVNHSRLQGIGGGPVLNEEGLVVGIASSAKGNLLTAVSWVILLRRFNFKRMSTR